MEILVPISLGELYDKIVILEIKMEQIKDEKKLVNISKELNQLKALNVPKITGDLYEKLKVVNQKRWNTEDAIREKERLKEFDERFIEFARLIYIINDSRSEVKREINVTYGSDFVEEKSYNKY